MSNSAYFLMLLPMAIILLIALYVLPKLLKLRKAKLAQDDSHTNFNEQAILLSPARPSIVGMCLIFFGAFLAFLSLSIMSADLGNLFHGENTFDGGDIGLSVFLIPCIAAIVAGARLFIRRNHIVQLTIAERGFFYRPIKFNPYPHRGNPLIISMLWSKKFLFIEYAQIEQLDLETLSYIWISAGNFIYIRAKDRDDFYLPVLFDNQAQYQEVFTSLSERVNAARR